MAVKGEAWSVRVWRRRRLLVTAGTMALLFFLYFSEILSPMFCEGDACVEPKMSKSAQPNELAVCVSGFSEFLDLSAPIVLQLAQNLRQDSSVFISTLFDENTYKLKHLDGLKGIKTVKVNSVEPHVLVPFFREFFSMAARDAENLAYILYANQECLSMIQEYEQKQNHGFLKIIFSHTDVLWSFDGMPHDQFSSFLQYKGEDADVLASVSRISLKTGFGSNFHVKEMLSAQSYFVHLADTWMNVSGGVKQKLKQKNSREAHMTLEKELEGIHKTFHEEHGNTPEEILVKKFSKSSHTPFPSCHLSRVPTVNSTELSTENVYGKACPQPVAEEDNGNSVDFRECVNKMSRFLKWVSNEEEILFKANEVCARVQMGPTEHLGTDYGGWRLFLPRLNSKSIIFSVGVGQDISFDLQVIEKYKCHVHAFDCTPVSMNWLKSQSPPEEWHHHPYLLGSTDGNLTLAMPVGFGTSFASLSANTKGFRDDVEKVTLPARTLRTLMGMCEVDKIDVLKIDIEGGEFSVIEGWTNGKGSAPKACQILIEYHGRLLPDGTNARNKAFSHLRSIGYYSVGCSSDSYGSDDCLFFSPEECLGLSM